MRVELNFSKKGSSAGAFIEGLKGNYPDIKIRKLKGNTKWKLVADLKFLNRKTNKVAIYRRVADVLGLPTIVFHAYGLKIGKPVKCHTCDGTGRSTYPNDFFADVPDEELK